MLQQDDVEEEAESDVEGLYSHEAESTTGEHDEVLDNVALLLPEPSACSPPCRPHRWSDRGAAS